MRHVRAQARPSIIFVAQRMMPAYFRMEVDGLLFSPLASLTRTETRQLIALLLKNANINYAADEIDKLAELCDGHPFNAFFVLEAVKEYTIPVVLGDPSELNQWKRRRASEFLQRIDFSPPEVLMVAALKDFDGLDFELLSDICDNDSEETSRAVVRLMDFHMLESTARTLQLTPAIRTAR